ncbi:MAG: hypothetical protein AAFO82_20475, partial [Bacteroidota bacterium]
MIISLDLDVYSGFLEDALVYDACQSMWRDIINKLSLVHGFSSKSYLNIYFKNGKKDRSGNSISSTMIENKIAIYASSKQLWQSHKKSLNT